MPYISCGCQGIWYENVHSICAGCHGSGRCPHFPTTCRNCGGSGAIYHQVVKKCPKCNGFKYIWVP